MTALHTLLWLPLKLAKVCVELKLKIWPWWKLAETATVCKLTLSSAVYTYIYDGLPTTSVPTYNGLRHLCTALHSHI